MKQVAFIVAFVAACFLISHFACNASWHLKPGTYAGTLMQTHDGIEKVSATIDDKGNVTGQTTTLTDTETLTGKIEDSGEGNLTLDEKGAKTKLTGKIIFGQNKIIGQLSESGAASGPVDLELNRSGD